MKFNVYAGASFRVGNASGATPTTAMYINSNGNVGIGGTSPTAQLAVYSSVASTTAPTLLLNHNSGYGQISGLDPFHSLILRGIPAGTTGYDVTTGDQMSFVEYGGDFRFYQKASAAPVLQGRLNLGTWTVTGDVVAYGSPSDITLKTNIKPLEGALEKVMRLQGVSFTWKEDTDTNKMTGIKDDIGFIAQEVQKLVPEVVTGKEGDISKGEILGITYSNLVPVLTKAIQEQQKQIEDQNAKIAAQQKQIEELIKLVKGQ
jgi:hypothetical protein